MAEAKTIYCPRCGRHVGYYDGRQTMNVIGNCHNCNKRVIYVVAENKIIIKGKPPRLCSSGLIYWG
jgi:hypothetical protein